MNGDRLETARQIVGGVVAGIVLGIVLIISNPFVSGMAESIVPAGVAITPQHQTGSREFGPPLDRPRSTAYLVVQVAFLALDVALLVGGILRLRRSTFQGVTAMVVAVVTALPFTPCTIDAVQNAIMVYTS